VAVDSDQRPVDPAGQRVVDNVLVAGATLAGAEPWREASGNGISVATGFAAAEAILEGTPSA
jgi:anaerobic glycerol-3-phosphate dehydrogenase